MTHSVDDSEYYYVDAKCLIAIGFWILLLLDYVRNGLFVPVSSTVTKRQRRWTFSRNRYSTDEVEFQFKIVIGLLRVGALKLQ